MSRKKKPVIAKVLRAANHVSGMFTPMFLKGPKEKL